MPLLIKTSPALRNLKPLIDVEESEKIMQPSRIKLLKFITTFAIAGTERQFMSLGRSLDASRFELHFACLKRRGDFLKEVEALRIPLAEYNFKSFYHPKVLKEQLRFAGYLKRNLIHIVHTYGFSPNVFAIPAAWLLISVRSPRYSRLGS